VLMAAACSADFIANSTWNTILRRTHQKLQPPFQESTAKHVPQGKP
jgi:hypothetical protein